MRESWTLRVCVCVCEKGRERDSHVCVFSVLCVFSGRTPWCAYMLVRESGTLCMCIYNSGDCVCVCIYNSGDCVCVCIYNSGDCVCVCVFIIACCMSMSVRVFMCSSM